VTEQFIAILKKDDEDKMLQFLRGLSPADKKKLIPQIKKSAKEYNEYGPIKLHGGRETYGHLRGTNGQRVLIQLASFVCFNRLDYEKSPTGAWILDKVKLNKILDWYCPSWFSDYVNKLGSHDFLPYALSYEWIMELRTKGLLAPSQELIVKTLPQAIFRQIGGHKWEYDPEPLLQYPITLEEHIWYLFELDSNLHGSSRWLNFEDEASKKQLDWIFLFKTFVTEGRLERFRVLQASLLASNRNFNKVLSGWFAQLFTELEPTKEELLRLQKELFSVLSSPQSKPVNTALQAIKLILLEKAFDAGTLLDTMPVLLSSDTKATVKTSLALMEKLAQKIPAYKERVALMACQCFIRSDNELQTRAAKLIEKSGDPANPVLRQEISGYQQSMLSSARQALAAFIDAETAGQNKGMNEVSNAGPTVDREELTAIPFPANIDDLVFLASQAFDNNEPWHLDVLAAALVQFTPELRPEDIPRFEPAFQRALKQNLPSTAGNLEHLLGLFFLDVGNWLIGKYPVASASIRQLYKGFDREEGGKNTSFLVVPEVGSYTARWEPPKGIDFYFPFRQFLLDVLGRIQRGSKQPLLSTPTHAPCWIDAGVLIQRLSQYQQSGQAPDNMDLQIAISRCRLSDLRAGALEEVDSLLSGELRQLMHFLLDETTVPQGPFTHKAAWMVAALTRKKRQEWPEFENFSYRKIAFNNYTGQLKWTSVRESYNRREYDYQTRKYKEIPSTQKKLTLKSDYTTADGSLIKKFFSKLRPAAKADPPMLYDFLHYTSDYIVSEQNDIKRILGLSPQNPEPILAETINECLTHPEFYQEGDKKMVTAVAQFLYEVWEAPGDMSYLFLGTCLLSVDKAIIQTAGETWLKAVSMGKIDNTALGHVIGLHERIEFAPLKRFTDLLTQHLFKVSPLHDQELQILIEHILPQLADEPIKNLKKLLETYGELIASNHSQIGNTAVANKLEHWRNKGDLAKVVDQIFKNQH
jgi:Family of unknown function (DUF6493)